MENNLKTSKTSIIKQQHDEVKTHQNPKLNECLKLIIRIQIKKLKLHWNKKWILSTTKLNNREEKRERGGLSIKEEDKGRVDE